MFFRLPSRKLRNPVLQDHERQPGPHDVLLKGQHVVVQLADLVEVRVRGLLAEVPFPLASLGHFVSADGTPDRGVCGKFRSCVLQQVRDLWLRPARCGVCLRPSRGHVFLPHLRVCAPERREYVLRLQEPKNEQKRLIKRSRRGNPNAPPTPDF